MGVLTGRFTGRLAVDGERGEQRSVVVVGAGITGLVAAYELRKRGVCVTLHEASRRTGGNIRTATFGEFLAEDGAQFATVSPPLSRLLAELQLADSVVEAAPCMRTRFVARGSGTHAMPRSLRDFVTSPLLTTGAKLRVLCEPLFPLVDDAEEESVSEFIQRRFGPQVLDYLVDPWVTASYAGDPDRLSIVHACPALYRMERMHASVMRAWLAQRRAARRDWLGESAAAADDHGASRPPRMISFRDGMQTLTRALEGAVGNAVHTASPVRLLHRREARWIVETGAEQSTRTTAVDAIVLAVPAHAVAAMELPAALRRFSSPIEQIEHPPISVLTLGFRREDVAHALDGAGLVVPRVEQRWLLAALFNSSLFPARAPAGHVTITCFVGGARTPDTARDDADELLFRTLSDLRELLGVRGHPVFRRHAFWRHAVPQYTLGYGDVHAAADAAELVHPGLYLAGNYRDGFTVADCVASGVRVAERVAAYLARAS